MKNAELAEIFSDLADILEYQGENRFKLNAYRRASRVLEDMTEDIEAVAAENRLRDLPGIGEAIASKIEEYLETGKMNRFEEAKAEAPSGLMDMLRVPGLGPKTVAMIHKELGISTLDELREAAAEGRLKGLPGIGPKKSDNIARGLEMMVEDDNRMLLGEALPLVESVIESMKKAGVERIVQAGSLRRMKDTIGDIDILAAGDDGGKTIDKFCELPIVERVLAHGDTKGSVVTDEGRQVDLRVVAPESFGAALQYFTGSQAHNVKIRDLAKRKGLKVNEYGVFKGDKNIAGETEEDVYKALGLPLIPPELREDRGEIEAAMDGKLPELLELSDIKGDLHAHTDYSDGHATIEQMAEAAKKRGYEYLAISDHSRALRVFGGMDSDELLTQVKEIRQIDKEISGIKLLASVEVDILGDGSLDLPDDTLEQLDFVTASIHSGFQQPREKITERVISAIRNPNVNSIGHPTGRLLNRRSPFDIDMDAVIKDAAKHGVALEINANPHRLDLTDVACRRAADQGVMIVINTDAHDTDDLGLMRFGVSVARRGWLSKKNILNALPLKELQKKLNK